MYFNFDYLFTANLLTLNCNYHISIDFEGKIVFNSIEKCEAPEKNRLFVLAARKQNVLRHLAVQELLYCATVFFSLNVF